MQYNIDTEFLNLCLYVIQCHNNYHAADHDCEVPLLNRYVKLTYTPTLDGFVLILACENEMSDKNTTDEQILNVTCYSNVTNWIPDPADFIKSCSPYTTVPPGTVNCEIVINNR